MPVPTISGSLSSLMPYCRKLGVVTGLEPLKV